MTDTHAGLDSHNSFNSKARVEHRDERIEQKSTEIGYRFQSRPFTRLPRETVALDPLEEALLELARSALRNRREVAERRGKMATIEGGMHGGRTA